MQSTPNTYSSEARIIIVDPHPLVREGLRMSLERKHNVEVVAEVVVQYGLGVRTRLDCI